MKIITLYSLTNTQFIFILIKGLKTLMLMELKLQYFNKNLYLYQDYLLKQKHYYY